MADLKTFHATRLARLLTHTVLGSPAFLALMATQQAHAQTSVVSACSGVSLPRSVVTSIISPVITGITGPTENAVNGLLNPLLPRLDLNATGLLDQAAAGDPITLRVLATDGTVVGPTDQCRLTADSITLDTPAGVAIGGNQITGLGANGAAAFASDINAVALGNDARAETGALAGVAIGQNSRVTAANSVALGAGSLAVRGALTGYTATGLAGAQNSAGEVSIGAPGALRQLTNVAAGTAASDAATVGQVDGVAAQVAVLDAASVQYDGAARDRVTLAGTAGTVIANLAPGALAAGSLEAVNGGQLFATNQTVAGNTTAIVNLDTRVTTTADALAALDATAVRYDAADRTAVTFGGAGGTILGNVGPGLLSTASTQAVNGAQLFATNTQVAANTAAIATLASGGGGNGTIGAVRYSDPGAPTVPNGGAVTNDVTVVGASGGTVGVHNVTDGTIAAGSSDAVTGGQLYTTNAAVGGNTTAIANLDTRVTTNAGQIATLTTNVATNTTAITDLQNNVATTNTNLVDLTVQVTANTTAITNLNNLVVGSTVNPVQYSDPGAPTTPNGGTLTNDVTLVGANGAAAVALHNVAGGNVAAGSTDAVNGDQLAAVSTTAANSLQYDRDANGTRTNTVTLAGGNAAAPVTVGNVAAGTVAAGSTQAVNGGQLYATNQIAQQAAALGATSVQYNPGNTSVTFNNTGGAVTLHNVAAGVAASDAVNVGQLQSGMQSAVAQANSYTDARVSAAMDAVNFDLGRVRRDIGAGTSSALAAAALPQANQPGRSMVAIGGGTYRGQTAVAIGASTYLNDGHSILRLGATYDSRGYGAANAGYGYQF